MHYNIVAAVLLASSCAAGNVYSQGISQDVATAASPGPPVASGIILRDRDTISDAIAGPLVDAISKQLRVRTLDMRLDAFDVQEVNSGSHAISGTGDVLVNGAGDWVGFRFRLQYNNRLRRVSRPEVSIGGVAAGEHQVPNDAHLLQQLEDTVIAALAHGSRRPSAWLRLDRVATVEGGSKYLRINAQGVVYIDRDGPGTPLAIEAIYDRSDDSWPKLEYGLGVEGDPR
ncbi:hypothetical protein [Lysobacter fragariae]